MRICPKIRQGAYRRMFLGRLPHFFSFSRRTRHVPRFFSSVATAHGKDGHHHEHHEELNEPTGYLFNRVVPQLEFIIFKSCPYIAGNPRGIRSSSEHLHRWLSWGSVCLWTLVLLQARHKVAYCSSKLFWNL